MQARLGFSIAAHVAPNILLVDEVLSVGDAVFRVRCLDHMSTLVRSGVTLLFVSHNLEQVRRNLPADPRAARRPGGFRRPHGTARSSSTSRP